MFGFFRFQEMSVFTNGAFRIIDGMMDTFFQNINSFEFSEIDFNEEECHETETDVDDIINFETFDDMYILSIKLKGVSLRELSIKYEDDIIDINLNRMEESKNYYMNNMIKRHYNKTFHNIEIIDTDRLFRSIDNGCLKITMPKKYVIDDKKVVDIEFIEIPKTEDNTQKLD